MSIAGKRAGMQHVSKGDEETTRSGMFYEAIRIIREMREATHGEYPKYAVWENVPGAFSSNKGNDFRCVLEEFVKIFGGGYCVPLPKNGKWLPAGEIVGDGFSVAWRVLDAQYWGVPQRRKRIYLVADFTGECAGKILFERNGLSGNFESSQATREGTADDAERGTGGSDRVECVTAAAFMGGQGCKAGGIGYSEDIAPTIKSVMSGSNTVPDVVYSIHDKATRYQGSGSTRKDDGAGNGMGVQDDGTMYTLDTAARHAVVYDARGNGDGETVPTLTRDHQNRVTDYTSVCVEGDGMAHASIDFDISPTLKARHTNTICAPSVKPPRRYIVRRLTPLECCRLQGFPDGWADIDRKDDFTDEELDFWRNVRNTHAAINGKQTKEYTKAQMLKWYNGLQTDSATYRMWGNGIALPCAQYVMEGIALALKESEVREV